MPYGEKLKTIKKDRGLTNVAIHKMCNVPLATVTRLFDEKNLSGNFETFVSIARGLNISLDELAGLKPPSVSVEEVHNSYSEILTKKDALIAEKDSIIVEKDNEITEKDKIIQLLKDGYQREHKGKNRLTSVLAIVAILVLIVFAIDVLNGHIGHIRY